MRIRCLYNTGNALRGYETVVLGEEQFGRFGASGNTEYGEIRVGNEYLVMGMIIFDTYIAYLIDDNGFVSACPCQLFEVIDDKVENNWHFRLVEKNEDIYPYIQAVYGYHEFCSDKKSYEKLIVEKDGEAMRIYFERKNDVKMGPLSR
jgi:hypothetical protein